MKVYSKEEIEKLPHEWMHVDNGVPQGGVPILIYRGGRMKNPFVSTEWNKVERERDNTHQGRWYGDFDYWMPLNPPKKKGITGECIICGTEVYGYDPKICCDGSECGCMGMPTEPCLCSSECGEALNSTGTLEERRKLHKIPYRGK